MTPVARPGRRRRQLLALVLAALVGAALMRFVLVREREAPPTAAAAQPGPPAATPAGPPVEASPPAEPSPVAVAPRPATVAPRDAPEDKPAPPARAAPPAEDPVALDSAPEPPASPAPRRDARMRRVSPDQANVARPAAGAASVLRFKVFPANAVVRLDGQLLRPHRENLYRVETTPGQRILEVRDPRSGKRVERRVRVRAGEQTVSAILVSPGGDPLAAP
jgi:hypothetical protein